MATRQHTRLLLICCAVFAPAANASDACSGRAVIAAADVVVSDGSRFQTEALFHSRVAAAVRHKRDTEQLIVVEGPTSWFRTEGDTGVGDDFHKVFALGHQYHAFLLYFEELADAIRETSIEFDGALRRARTGDYPYGGVVHLVDGDEADKPAGLRFEFEGHGPVDTLFSDWREHGDRLLPFLAVIVDGERQFDYRYRDITIDERSPLWFMEATGKPVFDTVGIYRLHRTLLAAHCLGDAALMASHSAENVLSANRGDLAVMSNSTLRERFDGLFERVNYREYHDLQLPHIEVSSTGDVGWIAVNVRAVGEALESGSSFDQQWAWLMGVRKVDGQWLHAGNASNLRPDQP